MEHLIAELWKLSPRGKYIVKVPVDVVQALGLEKPGASAVQWSAGKMTVSTASGAGAEDNGALETVVVTLRQRGAPVDGVVVGTGKEGGGSSDPNPLVMDNGAMTVHVL